MDAQRQRLLAQIGRTRGTPCYVYFIDEVRQRVQALKSVLGGRFEISYAVKANPNVGLLRGLRPDVALLDVSSAGELQRALSSGCPAAHISFSGPAKRDVELQAAAESGCEIVCESADEAEALSQLGEARGSPLKILLRLNPSRMPRRFGISMAGRPSQFGIDEEDLPEQLPRLVRLRGVELAGFHIYSGTNCLDADAIAENFAFFIELFAQAAQLAGCRPRKLVFGSGFGIPYFADEMPLELGALAERINPQIDALQADPTLAGAQCVLEMGRWLVGPAGYLLTQVIGAKRSRGVDIRLCDAGFNNHINAAGMMGTVIRRNWPFTHLSPQVDAPRRSYMLVGPLCTTADVLASQIELPEIRKGDVLAIGASGAYGLSASPARFISHPVPAEFIVDDGAITDVSETCP